MLTGIISVVALIGAAVSLAILLTRRSARNAGTRTQDIPKTFEEPSIPDPRSIFNSDIKPPTGQPLGHDSRVEAPEGPTVGRGVWTSIWGGAHAALALFWRGLSVGARNAWAPENRAWTKRALWFVPLVCLVLTFAPEWLSKESGKSGSGQQDSNDGPSTDPAPPSEDLDLGQQWEQNKDRAERQAKARRDSLEALGIDPDRVVPEPKASSPSSDVVSAWAEAITWCVGTRESNDGEVMQGPSGERGYYHILPATWEAMVKSYNESNPSRKANVDDWSQANQQPVVAWQFREWFNQALSPEKACLVWNGGSTKYESGVNDSGVAYDSQAYAASIHSLMLSRANAIELRYGLTWTPDQFYRPIDGSSLRNAQDRNEGLPWYYQVVLWRILTALTIILVAFVFGGTDIVKAIKRKKKAKMAFGVAVLISAFLMFIGLTMVWWPLLHLNSPSAPFGGTSWFFMVAGSLFTLAWFTHDHS